MITRQWAWAAGLLLICAAGCHTILGFDERQATTAGDGGAHSGGDDARGGGDNTGGDGAETSSSGGAGGIGGDGPVDTTPPTVVSVDPPHGATGVLEDATITVTFSEPMDQAATVSALSTTNLNELVTSWNEAGDELTLTPTESLVYAEGTVPADVDAIVYSLEFGPTATDSAGNSLFGQAHHSFSTARRIVQSLQPVNALTGYVSSIGSPIQGFPLLGDGTNNSRIVAFISFALAPEMLDSQLWLGIEHAELMIDQGNGQGDPSDLGAVLIDHHSFASISSKAASSASLAQLGMLSTFTSPGPRTMTVTTEVEADAVAQRSYSQYRLRFEVATNWNDTQDWTTFNRTGAEIEVTYLLR